ncbi:MAG TPA: hypothetical protein VKF38_08575 [Anaerolineaceae bacterium]|nr:hypothetical protein [Anaerolineaceae bacterium]
MQPYIRRITSLMVSLPFFLSACTSMNAMPVIVAPTLAAKSLSIAAATNTVVDKEKILSLNSNNQITLSDSDGRNARQYLLEPNVIAAALSPDGKKIAYDREEPLNNILFLLDVQTGQSTQLSKGQIAGHPGTLLWSPKGDQLFLSCTVGDSSVFQIYTVDLSSGAMTPLTSFTNGLPFKIVSFNSLSNDGNTIGLTTLTMPPQGGFSQGTLQILDVKSRQIKTVLDEGHSGDIIRIGGAYLSPDGKTIFFIGKQNEHYRVFRIGVDGSHLQQVTQENASYDIAEPVVFSPDGTSFFAYTGDQKPGDPNGVPTLFSTDGNLIRQLSDYPNGKVVSWIKVPQ